MIEKTSYLENNIVLVNDYQEDKKSTKVEMEFLKSDIKTMLNEALTP